jgi:hypothetical protein
MKNVARHRALIPKKINESPEVFFEEGQSTKAAVHELAVSSNIIWECNRQQ